jgi:hypothetical protein
MATQKFMGKHQLIDRLAAQVGNKASAVTILKKRGDLKADGKTLTAAGKKRDAMTAEERAKDRSAKAANRKTSEYKYSPKTNRATLKGR